jgi:uncharacterized protein
MRTSTPVSVTSPPRRPDHPLWPHSRLDATLLRQRGWRPTPLREFVLKVHQRCNLACDYCYVYELADQSWRTRPKIMAPAIWRAAASRIAEHADRHGLKQVSVVLHGGEPLLAGPDRLLRLITDLRSAMPTGCDLTIGMQTNGVALDQEMLVLLAGARVRIGVSVDGVAADHDRHRKFRNGEGSHYAVDRALRRLSNPPFRSAFAGLLCTVDPTIDAVGTYEELLRYAPPSIDFLLPHANWATPPSRTRDGATPHGDWLAAAFDRWYDAPRRETHVRLFEEVMNLLLGGASRSEQVGLSPVAVAVIESDGAIEQVDSLKSSYPGACATGLHVLTGSFDAALEHPGIIARQLGIEALGETCRQCPVQRVCGGGHYAHRYRPDEGFQNPSVYCADMQVLIGHVSRRMATDLARLGAGDNA